MAPQPACLAGSKVLLGERVAPFRVVFPPNRRLRRRFGGNVFRGCETQLIAKLIHRARQARWGLSNTLAEATLAEARAELRR